MRPETLEALVGAAEEQISKYIPGSALAATWEAIVREARAELERMRRVSIADDQITILESEIQALGWRYFERNPDGDYRTLVEYFDPYDLFCVRFLNSGGVEVFGLQSLEGTEPAGVKTVDDLLDLIFKITGKRAA